jgi:hypothetical protein
MTLLEIIQLAYSPFDSHETPDGLPDALMELIKVNHENYEATISDAPVYSWNQIKRKPHPWPNGVRFWSPNQTFIYEVVGPICRLYDREQLPWPHCQLSMANPKQDGSLRPAKWGFQPVGKMPSWNRQGRRFILDLGTKGRPSYNLKLFLGNPGPDYKYHSLKDTTLPLKLSDAQGHPPNTSPIPGNVLEAWWLTTNKKAWATLSRLGRPE